MAGGGQDRWAEHHHIFLQKPDDDLLLPYPELCWWPEKSHMWRLLMCPPVLGDTRVSFLCVLEFLVGQRSG